MWGLLKKKKSQPKRAKEKIRMKLKEFYTVRDLQGEIKLLEELIQKSRDSATKITPSYSLTPKIKDNSKTSKVESGACAAVDYESQLVQKKAELEKERAYKLQVILMCNDSLVRQAMVLKFIEGDRNVSWTYVAGRLNTSEKSLLMACKRYVASV